MDAVIRVLTCGAAHALVVILLSGVHSARDACSFTSIRNVRRCYLACSPTLDPMQIIVHFAGD